MVVLRAFTNADALLLQQLRYPDHSLSQVEEMIGQWAKGEVGGRAFAMYAVCDAETVVGTVSLYALTGQTVSAGPEIFAAYRRRGYGKQAVEAALEQARRQGYKIAWAQIRTDNTASLALHRSLGFASDEKVFLNAKGSPVQIWLKSLA